MSCGSDRRHDSGFALVTVLWVLAILTVIAFGFSRRAMTERQAAWYLLDHAQALHLSRGAVERGILELRNRIWVDRYYEQEGYTALNQRWARPVDLLEESDYYSAFGDDAFREDESSFVIRDCESKIAINYVPEKLLRSINTLDYKVVDALLDLRARRRPGDLANRIRTLDEFRALGDFDDAEWYGDTPGEGLRDLFTVWGDPSRGRININTASGEVLRTLPGLDAAVVEALIAYRNGSDGLSRTMDDRMFRSIDEVASILELSAETIRPLRDYCKTTSNYFTIEGHATRRRGTISASCTAVVKVIVAQVRILEWRETPLGT